MQIDPLQQTTANNYKLVTNRGVLRPIAWVTSVSEQGVINLAPIRRMGSASMYCRTTDRLEAPRVGYAQWESGVGAKTPS